MAPAEDSLFSQSSYNLRCEWGLAGLRACLPGSDVLVIVDVLSFSTSVDVALGRGGVILPYDHRDDRAAEYARERGAELASRDRGAGFSLSPASLQALPAGTCLVMPSPNGATLSLATGTQPTLAGCLRNAAAVARAAGALGRHIAVIAAGERWPDGSLRFALEDWLGAGAVIHGLPGTRSVEAAAAEAAFHRSKTDLLGVLTECGSGRELIERGFAEDVALAAALNVSETVPMLTDGAYCALSAPG